MTNNMDVLICWLMLAGVWSILIVIVCSTGLSYLCKPRKIRRSRKKVKVDSNVSLGQCAQQGRPLSRYSKGDCND